MQTYKELLAAKSDLEAQLERARQNEIFSFISEIKEKISEYNLTEFDLGFSKKKSKQLVQPKFRDPISGKTWSGRGVSPLWIQGKNKMDYLINRPQQDPNNQVHQH